MSHTDMLNLEGNVVQRKLSCLITIKLNLLKLYKLEGTVTWLQLQILSPEILIYLSGFVNGDASHQK